jgi:hypothetical protein
VPALQQDSITLTNSFVPGLDQQFAYEVATFGNMRFNQSQAES